MKLGTRVDLLLDRAPERRAAHDLAHHLRALGEHLEVGGVVEVARSRSAAPPSGRPRRAAACRGSSGRSAWPAPSAPCAGRRRDGSARPGSARRRPTAAGAAGGRVRRWPARCARSRPTRRPSWPGTTCPGAGAPWRTPSREEEGVALQRRRWSRGRSSRGTCGRAGCRRPGGRRSVVMPCSVRCSAWPIAREHQQLRRADEAGREDDLLAGAHDAVGAVLVDDGDARSARPFSTTILVTSTSVCSSSEAARRGCGCSRARRCSEARRRCSAASGRCPPAARRCSRRAPSRRGRRRSPG